MEQYDHNPVRILCGPGNNGGDGWIMAAALRAAGWPVLVSALPPRSEFCQKAHALAQTAGVAEIPLTQKTAPNLVVDAVFGAGFRDVVPPKT
jgi:NAD(P)H-hydrate epimerase